MLRPSEIPPTRDVGRSRPGSLLVVGAIAVVVGAFASYGQLGPGVTSGAFLDPGVPGRLQFAELSHLAAVVLVVASALSVGTAARPRAAAGLLVTSATIALLLWLESAFPVAWAGGVQALGLVFPVGTLLVIVAGSRAREREEPDRGDPIATVPTSLLSAAVVLAACAFLPLVGDAGTSAIRLGHVVDLGSADPWSALSAVLLTRFLLLAARAARTGDDVAYRGASAQAVGISFAAGAVGTILLVIVDREDALGVSPTPFVILVSSVVVLASARRMLNRRA